MLDEFGRNGTDCVLTLASVDGAESLDTIAERLSQTHEPGRARASTTISGQVCTHRITGPEKAVREALPGDWKSLLFDADRTYVGEPQDVLPPTRTCETVVRRVATDARRSRAQRRRPLRTAEQARQAAGRRRRRGPRRQGRGRQRR